MLSLFLQFEIKKIIGFFKTKTLAKVITSALFLIIFTGVGIVIYGFFLGGLRYINVNIEPEIQLPLTLFIYEVFLVILGGIIIFSSLVSSIFTLFRSERNNWLLSTPGYRMFPNIVLVKSFLTSLWPLFIMFLPAILAFNKIYHLGIITLLLILVSVVLFSITLTTITLLTLVLASHCYYILSRAGKRFSFSLRELILGIVAVIAVILVSIWKSVKSIDLVSIFKADQVDIDVTVSAIAQHFHFLPTHPFAYELAMLQSGRTGEAILYFGIITLLAVVGVVLWLKLSHLFYPSWQKFQEGNYHIQKEGEKRFFKGTTFHFNGGVTIALLKKEILISTRNMKGVLWFLFLISIWLAQIGTNVILSHNIQKYQPDITQKIAILQALQFIIAIYFICSFTLRFAFPSFSTEKKTAWILGSAPLNFRKIFIGKYLFYTSFFTSVGLVMSLINARVLHLDLIPAMHSLLLFVTTVIFVVTFGIVLGLVFPSLDSDDPEVISTSMPGLFFTAVSLLYGSLSAWILYASLSTGMVTPLYGFIVLTLLFVGVMLLSAPRLTKNRGW